MNESMNRKNGEYVYLGLNLHDSQFGRNSEIERRIRPGWNFFGKMSEVFKGANIPINLKRRIF